MHLVLLGDSVFDNGLYVGAGQSITDHLRRLLPEDVALTRLAVDGHMSAHVAQQLEKMPDTATHIALSVGGNDALAVAHLLETPCVSISDALHHLSEFQQKFARDYLRVKALLLALNLPVLVCTIYDAVPGLPAHLKTALSLFNDVITKSIHDDLNDILDLRTCLSLLSDFSIESPIEPSNMGGLKIAEHIAGWVHTYRQDPKR